METSDIQAALAAPFDPDEIKWKPGKVSGNRCLGLAYIDARLVQDRLDDVLGIGNWQDAYTIDGSGSVECRLSLKLNGEWITKCDIGSLSEQPDAGDKLKAAFSDALKRAAVKFGVGRYLYALKSMWCDFDPVKKFITNPPELPAWARPQATGTKLPGTELATVQQVYEMNTLALQLGPETEKKWLDAAHATEWADLTQDQITKAIAKAKELTRPKGK